MAFISEETVGGASSSMTGLDIVLTLPLARNLVHTNTHTMHDYLIAYYRLY